MWIRSFPLQFGISLRRVKYPIQHSHFDPQSKGTGRKLLCWLLLLEKKIGEFIHESVLTQGCDDSLVESVIKAQG